VGAGELIPTATIGRFVATARAPELESARICSAIDAADGAVALASDKMRRSTWTLAGRTALIESRETGSEYCVASAWRSAACWVAPKSATSMPIESDTCTEPRRADCANDGCDVGRFVGAGVGIGVGAALGLGDGTAEGAGVGTAVDGTGVGTDEGVGVVDG